MSDFRLRPKVSGVRPNQYAKRVETLNFGLRLAKVSTANHFNFRLSKCKQNKYVTNDVVAWGGVITDTDRTPLTIYYFFLFASEIG